MEMSQKLEDNFLKLYNDETPFDQFKHIFESYEPSASFVDPVVEVQGRKNIKLLFIGLRNTFAYNVESHQLLAGKKDHNIFIEATICYKLRLFGNVLLPFPIHMVQYTEFRVNPVTEQISYHRDRWCQADIIREAFPSIYSIFAKISGHVQLLFIKGAILLTNQFHCGDNEHEE
eukprot:EG_transcript_32292